MEHETAYEKIAHKTKIGEQEAEGDKYAASQLSDFEIIDGVLKKYKGEADKVVIPSSVTAIAEYAFFRCRNLKSVHIPDSVTSIGAGAFFCCDSLTSISIPSSVISIGNCAFSGCDNLKSLTVDKANPKYRSEGNCVIEVRSKTLICGCKKSLIPSNGSVISIGEYAFSVCISLESIKIPNYIISIGKHAFFECRSLTSIDIPSSVESIGEGAFSGCSSLTSIYIPSSVETIDSDIFKYCSNLKIIYCRIAEEPFSWNKRWRRDCYAKVVWGCRPPKNKSIFGKIFGKK